MTTPCEGCGAPRDGLFCHFCGAVSSDAQGAERERAVLDELHRAARETTDEEAIERLLRTAPIPSQGPVLVDAVVHVVGILDAEQTFAGLGEGTYARAQTLLARLRVLGDLDPKTERARVELERATARYVQARESMDRSTTRILGAGCIFVVLAALGAYFVFFA